MRRWPPPRPLTPLARRPRTPVKEPGIRQCPADANVSEGHTLVPSPAPTGRRARHCFPTPTPPETTWNATVSAHLVFKTAANTKVAMAIAAARNDGYSSFEESLSVQQRRRGGPADRGRRPPRRPVPLHGVHRTQPRSRSITQPRWPAAPSRKGATLAEPIRYVRPSRYAESDRLLPTAYAEFGGLRGRRPADQAVRNWVYGELRYISGSSRGTDGAVETLLQPPRRVPGLRAPGHRAAAVQGRPGPARRGVRPRPVPHGFPCRGRGLRGRGLARHRPHRPGPAGVHAADHRRPGLRPTPRSCPPWAAA